jgi:hypothetical protein
MTVSVNITIFNNLTQCSFGDRCEYLEISCLHRHRNESLPPRRWRQQVLSKVCTLPLDSVSRLWALYELSVRTLRSDV